MRTLNETIAENAVHIGDKTAVQTKKEALTYSEIAEWTGILAGYFRTLGIHSGDRVLLEAIPETSYILSYLALRSIGAVTAPVERGIKEDQLYYMADLLDAVMYISKKDNRAEGKLRIRYYENVLKEAKSWGLNCPFIPQAGSETAEIIFTTGTTGRPKAALHSVEGICCNTMNTVTGIGMRQDDCILLPLPLNHSFGMRVLRAALETGACVVLQNGAIFADAMTDSIKKYKCTAMACVSATMESVLREIGEERVREEFSCLRYMEFSAGALPQPMREKLLELLPGTEIHNTWGSSETGGCLFLNLRKHPDKIKAVGKAPEHIALGIFDDTEDKLIDGSGKENVGRLAIRGEMVFHGYLKQEDVYRESVRDGWYITNDLVWRDEDGFYYMLGRADNVINVGGEKIAPSEIENALFRFTELSGCACIGIPDSEGVLGEVPILLYAVREGCTADQEALKKAVTEKVGVYRTPRRFIEVPSVPRNYMKKTDYKLLKKIYKEKGEAGFAELPAQAAEEETAFDLDNAVIRAIMHRKSQRRFTEELIPQPVIDVLVEAAKCAPSGKNLQTRRFTVISDQAEIMRLKEIIGGIAKEKHTSFNGFENPPLLILISNDRRNKDGIQDVGVSAENIMIAAESLGLGSVWLNPLMDISDEPVIREKLDAYTIPKNHIVWAVMAVGRPAGPPPEFYRKPNEVYYIA